MPIPVIARIVWRIDREAWLDSLAARSTTTAVQVELDDYRLGPLATWVAPSDVRRRLGTTPRTPRSHSQTDDLTREITWPSIAISHVTAPKL